MQDDYALNFLKLTAANGSDDTATLSWLSDIHNSQSPRYSFNSIRTSFIRHSTDSLSCDSISVDVPLTVTNSNNNYICSSANLATRSYPLM